MEEDTPLPESEKKRLATDEKKLAPANDNSFDYPPACPHAMRAAATFLKMFLLGSASQEELNAAAQNLSPLAKRWVRCELRRLYPRLSQGPGDCS